MAVRQLCTGIAAATARFLFGITIMSSPWLFGFTGVHAAGRDTWIVGALICIATVTAGTCGLRRVGNLGKIGAGRLDRGYSMCPLLQSRHNWHRAAGSNSSRTAGRSAFRTPAKSRDPPRVSARCAAAARRVVRSSSNRGATPCYPADRPSFGASWLIFCNFSMAIPIAERLGHARSPRKTS